MKKIVLCCTAFFILNSEGFAQRSEAGLPLSITESAIINTKATTCTYIDNPDWNQYLVKEKNDTNFTKPYLVALTANANFSFPQSGTLKSLPDGRKVWQAQIVVDGAPAIGFYYDKFHLPAGVKLFLSNYNGKQILGAYTQKNNNATTHRFANEAVQGQLVNIELDIDANVNINDIMLSINKVAVYHRGIENLKRYAIGDMQLIDGIDDALNGASSVCMINSVCPPGVGYDSSRLATLEYLSVTEEGVGGCSGTMINNTGNSTESCTQYMLTATHCDPSNSTANSHFDQFIFRYNFEHSNCEGSDIPNANTLLGATFVARADYDASASINTLKGDFLLLKINDQIPASWNVVFSGWNRDANIPTSLTEPEKFIGFHHPATDNKKLMVTHDMEATSISGSGAKTHWGMMVEEGYIAQGSSGSGLFNANGKLIGIASVAGNLGSTAPGCDISEQGMEAQAMDFVFYSRLSYDWDYSLDGNDASRKLKPWLDPTNSGITTLGSVNSDCSNANPPIVSVENLNHDDLNGSLSIYPNPVSNGIVEMIFNLKNETPLTISVVDINGKIVHSSKIASVKTGQYQLNVSNIPNGIYLLKFQTANSTASKKLIIAK